MASFNNGLRTNVLPLGVTSIAATTAPTTNGGNTVNILEVEPGTLSMLFYSQAKVNTMTIEPQWQVSADGSTWYSAKQANNAAAVVTVTGTGSNVSSTVVVTAPDAVYGWAYARGAAINRVADAVDSNDQYDISYNYLLRGSVPR